MLGQGQSKYSLPDHEEDFLSFDLVHFLLSPSPFFLQCSYLLTSVSVSASLSFLFLPLEQNTGELFL